MVEITRAFAVDAPAHLLWAALNEAGEVSTGFNVRASLDGCAGSAFSGAEGARAILAALDEQLHRLALVAKRPLAHHAAAFQVAHDGPQRCRVVWSHRIAPCAAPGFADAIDASALTLRKMFERRG